MCELTIPDSPTGYARHRTRKEPACRECKDAINSYHYVRKEYDGDYRRANVIWYWYRLRWHEYQAMLEKQDFKCAICEQPFKNSLTTHIDHDHGCDHQGRGRKCCSQCVRGVLCQRCNTGLAILEDPERLKKALDYLNNETTAEILRQSRLW